jgi:hypothetical protein
MTILLMPLTLMLVACDGGKTEGDTAGLGEITDDTGGGRRRR